MILRDKGLEPGELFGAYEITRRIGTGAFGAVYEAVKRPLGKRVALKVLHATAALQPVVVSRFLREAQSAAQLAHPHIVDVIDVGEVGDRAFMAMEYLEGETLAARIKRDGALGVEATVDLLVPLFSAVETVHGAGIVHRDIKPENLFLARTRGGGVTLKLLDFGIAKVHEAGVDRGLTATSTLMGTPHYMSPEQARESKSVDARSDQWSLGVILYECLAGRKPFDSESLLGILTAITALPLLSPRMYLPDIPDALEAIVLRALEKDPARRFGSVREFGAALLPFASAAVRQTWSREFLGVEAASVAPVAPVTPVPSMQPMPSMRPVPSMPPGPGGVPQEQAGASGATLSPTSVVATASRAEGGRPVLGRGALAAGLVLAVVGLAGGLLVGRRRGGGAGETAGPVARTEVPARVVEEAAGRPGAAGVADAAAVVPVVARPVVATAVEPLVEAEAGVAEVAPAAVVWVDAGAARVVPAVARVAAVRDAGAARVVETADAGAARVAAAETADAGAGAGRRPTRTALQEAMTAVTPQVRACSDGTGAVAVASVVFAGTGEVVAAGVAPPLSGTPMAECILRALRQARVTPFEQATFTLRYRFHLPGG